jgi:hypothetical protein
MSYVIITLVLATLFGLDAYETALAIFIAAFLIHLCRAEKSCKFALDSLERRQGRVARERVQEMGPSCAENFRKLPPPPFQNSAKASVVVV